jgi:hypothetical protein
MDIPVAIKGGTVQNQIEPTGETRLRGTNVEIAGLRGSCVSWGTLWSLYGSALSVPTCPRDFKPHWRGEPLLEKTMPEAPALKFKIAPHLLQDLGLNLYTNLPRVLVEFVANAYDADSPSVDIRADFALIESERSKLKAQFQYECGQCKGNEKALSALKPLSQRVLPAQLSISIIDEGCGMARNDLKDRFLITGRRRREEEKKGRSEGGRLLMGRKGVGKLAGFGVAQKVTLKTRKKGERHATKIVLDYNEIKTKSSMDEVVIPDTRLNDGGGIKNSGTTIILSDLLHGPLGSHPDTIAAAIADQFWLIDQSNFVIKINGKPIPSKKVTFNFAWPEPEVARKKFIQDSYETEDGVKCTYKYRLRFRDVSLRGADRGIRVYAHGRLASMPSLLQIPTGIHGFKYTDYLDGVVIADFIDDQNEDYVATDRQSLRWETPLLEPLRERLTAEIRKACTAYYNERQEQAEKEAKEDSFTKRVIKAAKLPPHRQAALTKMAVALGSHVDGGVKSEEYKSQFKIVADAMQQGDILHSLRGLAQQPLPNLAQVIEEVSELTARELADFTTYIYGRLNGIDALRSITSAQDFKKGGNEKEIHDLLNRNPWLIDPTFTQFLTSNQTEDTVFVKLAQQLKVGKYTPKNKPPSEDRPDLVFLLGSDGLNRVVIVELKAPNVPLDKDHLDQLRGYIIRARKWLQDRNRGNYQVEGILIGCRAPVDSKAAKVILLADHLENRKGSDERVFDLTEVLAQTKKAHEELLEIYKRASKAALAD